jgi:hypothetical protein
VLGAGVREFSRSLGGSFGAWDIAIVFIPGWRCPIVDIFAWVFNAVIFLMNFISVSLSAVDSRMSFQ